MLCSFCLASNELHCRNDNGCPFASDAYLDNKQAAKILGASCSRISLCREMDRNRDSNRRYQDANRGKRVNRFNLPKYKTGCHISDFRIQQSGT